MTTSSLYLLPTSLQLGFITAILWRARAIKNSGPRERERQEKLCHLNPLHSLRSSESSQQRYFFNPIFILIVSQIKVEYLEQRMMTHFNIERCLSDWWRTLSWYFRNPRTPSWSRDDIASLIALWLLSPLLVGGEDHRSHRSLLMVNIIRSCVKSRATQCLFL